MTRKTVSKTKQKGDSFPMKNLDDEGACSDRKDEKEYFIGPQPTNGRNGNEGDPNDIETDPDQPVDAEENGANSSFQVINVFVIQ
jgi:hypothetical protein